MKTMFLGSAYVLPLLWLVAQEKWDRRWVDYYSKGGSFSVVLPTSPREGNAHLPSRKFGMKNFIWFRADDNNLRYTVAYTDYTGSLRQESRLDLHALTSDFTPEPARDTATRLPLQLDDFPGEELCYERPGGSWIRQRTWLVDRRLYLVQVLGSHDDIWSENAERFFRSFRAFPI